MTEKLTTTDHNRGIVGLKYIYPVISRRAGGLSIGVNFNTNNACNWRCIYCQVPDLIRGAAPAMDLKQLQKELVFFLDDVLRGSFFDRFHIAEKNRVIKDISISGNGEPTSLNEFANAVSLIGEIMSTKDIKDKSNFVLITNGSLLHRQHVQDGLVQLQKNHGQVWFKMDSATENGRKLLNNAAISQQQYVENLLISAKLCPTWLQTCLFTIDGHDLMQQESQAYLDLLAEIHSQVALQGVLLYSIARPSLQPEANTLSVLPAEKMHEFAEKIRALGLDVRVSN
jgi:wyosine [tRNA(Phe)-imidazoG37] synthetase (radical SAM superfamily)